MKQIIITGQWLNTLRLPHERPYFVKKIFDDAQTYGWNVRIAGEHWGA